MLTLGLGIGLGTTRGGGGAAAPALPSGALGYWDANDYTTTGRDRIPNRLGTMASDGNLGSGPRRVFKGTSGTTRFWTSGNGTSTDCAVPAPDGSIEASTFITSGATNWALTQTSSLPAGTYTVAVSLRDVASAVSTFKLGRTGTSTTIHTMTGAWQRFTHTFTIASTTTVAWGIQTDAGTSAVSIAVCDMEIFAGSSDLNADWATAKPLRLQNSDIIMGRHHGHSGVSVVDGEVSMASVFASMQLPAGVTPSAFTFIYNGTRRTQATQSWETILSTVTITARNYDLFTVGADVASGPSIRLAGSAGSSSQMNDGLFGGCAEKGTWAITYDGANQKAYVHGVEVLNQARTTALQEMRDFYFGSLDGASNYSSYDFGTMVMWDRALSAAEVAQAMEYIEQDKAMPAKRLIVLEGDSITAQQTARVGFNMTTAGFGSLLAVAGAIIAGGGGNSLDSRKTTVDAIYAGRAAGTTGILTVLIGANDLTGPGYPTTTDWLDRLAIYLDERRATGWKVVLCTILPQSGDATFNARRATANTAIRTWVGVHCDAVADYAADATMGPDDSYTVSPTRWSDTIHPSSLGHDILAPILAAAIDSI